MGDYGVEDLGRLMDDVGREMWLMEVDNEERMYGKMRERVEVVFSKLGLIREVLEGVRDEKDN